MVLELDTRLVVCAAVMALLGRLNAELGKTLVMVTHDAHCAAAAHRVLHLDKGQLAESPDVAAPTAHPVAAEAAAPPA